MYMKLTWKSETDLAKWRTSESFKPFGDLLPDQDGKISQVLARTQVTPLWAKEWRCCNGWSVGPRIMSYCVWWLFPDNKGWIRLIGEEKTIPVNPGDLVLIPEGIEHAGGLSGKGQMRQLAGHFKADVFGSINLFKLVGFPILIPASKDAPFYPATNRMIREYALQPPGWQNAMASELFNIILYVVRERGSLFHTARFTEAYEVVSRMMPVLEEIEKSLPNHNFSPNTLAGSTGFSEILLRKMFKMTTGTSPVAFIQRQRINKACELLRFTCEGIKKISAQCGFAELSFFYRVFKRWTGMTPARFRANSAGNFPQSQ